MALPANTTAKPKRLGVTKPAHIILSMQHCFHNYSQYANLTQNWVGTDHPRSMRLLTDPAFYPTWVQSGWSNNTVIEYKFNSGGFRTDEFDQSERIMILGSSPTVGVGLHQHQTWSEQLSKKINVPIWNLATGTGCLDTMYRVLKNYISQLNITMVIEVGGEKEGFELYAQDNWKIVNSPGTPIGAVTTDIKGAINAWYAHEENYNLNQEKTTDAMHWICEKNKVPYYKFSMDKISKEKCDPADPVDWSRCGHHVGPKFHSAAADYVAERINR